MSKSRQIETSGEKAFSIIIVLILALFAIICVYPMYYIIIGSVSDIPSEIVDAPHVHLEVLANGKYLDPMTLINLN